MLDFSVEDIFSSRADIIVVPCFHDGTIPSTYIGGLVDLGVKPELNYSFGSLGHVKIKKTNSSITKYIAFVSTYDKTRLSFPTIRKIGVELALQISSLDVRKVACPLIGTGTNRLDPIQCHNVLINAFYEVASEYINFDLFTLEENALDNFQYNNIDRDIPSFILVLDNIIDKIIEWEISIFDLLIILRPLMHCFLCALIS